MAVTIDWPTSVITVHKADMVQIQSVPSEIYQLDMDTFRLTLKDLEDDEAGMVWPKTHDHNTTVTVSGAVLARVVQILDPYTVTFEDGQYRVNIVGANTNIGEKTNVNQVSVSTSNSAGLQDLNSLQAASFGGAVAFKPSSAYSGTVFPVGTRQYPVNNTADLKTILANRGINRVNLLESLTIDSGTDFSGLAVTFVGDNPAAINVVIDTAANVTNCQFTNMTVSGVLDGANVFRDCSIGNLTYVNGFIHDCALTGTIVLGGGQLLIMDSYSGIPGGGPGEYPIIDMGGSGNDLALRAYDGGLGIKNCTSTNSSFDFNSGRVVFDSTVTGGSIWVRGVAEVTDNSVGATIYDYTISEDITFIRKLIDANETLAEGSTDNWQLIDPDDGITVLRTRSVTDKDGNAITIPVGVPARRTNS